MGCSNQSGWGFHTCAFHDPFTLGTYYNASASPRYLRSVTVKLSTGSGSFRNGGNSWYGYGNTLAVRLKCGGAWSSYCYISRVGYYGSYNTTYYTFSFGEQVVVQPWSTVWIDYSTNDCYSTNNILCQDKNYMSADDPVQEPPITIHYNANGGANPPADQSKQYGASVSISGAPGTPATLRITFDGNGGTSSPAYMDYQRKFVSWNTQADGKGQEYAPGTVYSTHKALNLYAVWGDAPVTSLATATMTNYKLATGETYTGTCGDFEYWSTDRTNPRKVTLPWSIASNLTLYAIWTYYIKFHANGGEIFDESRSESTVDPLNPCETQVYKKGYNITFRVPTTFSVMPPNDGTSNVPDKPPGSTSGQITDPDTGEELDGTEQNSPDVNIDFHHWTPYQDGRGTKYVENSTYSTNAPLILYAQYELKEFKVTYMDGWEVRDVNGNITRPEQIIPVNGAPFQMIKYNQNAVVPPDPERLGFEFIGWSQSNEHICADRVIHALWNRTPVWIWVRETMDGKQVEHWIRYQPEEK